MRWDGSPLPGSNWGAIYGTQGIWPPARTFRSPARTDGQNCARTSYATAIVSGVVALLLCRERKRGRALRPLSFAKALLAAARSVGQTGSDSRRFLAGRLNITEAIHLLDTWSTTMTHEISIWQLSVIPHRTTDATLSLRRSVSQASRTRRTSAVHRAATCHARCAPHGRRRRAAAVGLRACRGERQLVYAWGK